MANIIFTKGGDTFTFSKGRQYPINDPVRVNVVIAYSEGRQLYAYNKGIEEQLFNLVFRDLTQTDFDNVEDWILNIVVGPTSTFTYTDESSVEHTVRCLNLSNPLQQIKYLSFAGTIRLRKEI